MVAAGSKTPWCATCAARIESGREHCPYCGAKPLVSSTEVVTRSVHDAAAKWASGVLTAPRHFDELITSVDVQDEVITRVAREVFRREVHEERRASTQGRATPPRVHPAAVEPFNVTLADLKARSEHVAVCRNCAGQGGCTCTTCHGSKQMTCGDCGGSGQVLKHYKKTSRYIQCKTCRKKGTVRCTHCAATGWLICNQCAGSGHEAVWLSYREHSRWEVKNHPPSPVIAAHRQLREDRFLSPGDLGAFGVLSSHEGVDGTYRDLPVQPADPRLERVTRQQILKLSVVRRDAVFEMAGMQGTLVLSGRELAAARLDDAMVPIKRRNVLGTLGCGALAVGGFGFLAKLSRQAEYFAAGNRVMLLLCVAGLACLAVFIAGVLRAWRPRGGLAGLRSYEKVAAALGVFLFLGLPATSALTRPKLSEAQSALAAGDVPRARAVATALLELDPASTAVVTVDDEVSLAEAHTQPLAKRLTLLDRIAEAGGSTAARAAREAEGSRLEHVRGLLAKNEETEALSALDQWFPPAQKASAEVVQVRGQIYDTSRSRCASTACTFLAAQRALEAAPTPERTATLTRAKDELRAELVAAAPAGETALSKVQRLQKVMAAGAELSGAQLADSELGALAQTASAQATTDLRAMAAVGSALPVAEALLGGQFNQVGAARLMLDGPVAIRLVADAQGRCAGLYVVGAKAGARAIKGGRWEVNSLLSQAVGRPTAVRAATARAAKWSEGGVPVTARWNGNELVELRVGAVSP